MTLPAVTILLCKHEVTRLTRRHRASHWHYARQCDNCGNQIGAFVKKETAYKESKGRLNELPVFAEDLWEQRNQQQQAQLKEVREAENAEWWAWYNDYLKTDEWRARADRVHRRAAYVCEGCGAARSAHVHHRTYKHVGNEFLFELVALCLACHERIHAAADDAK